MNSSSHLLPDVHALERVSPVYLTVYLPGVPHEVVLNVGAKSHRKTHFLQFIFHPSTRRLPKSLLKFDLSLETRFNLL